MNALRRHAPGDLGVACNASNLHKTFCYPTRRWRPGAGPVCHEENLSVPPCPDPRRKEGGRLALESFARFHRPRKSSRQFRVRYARLLHPCYGPASGRPRKQQCSTPTTYAKHLEGASISRIPVPSMHESSSATRSKEEWRQHMDIAKRLIDYGSIHTTTVSADPFRVRL